MTSNNPQPAKVIPFPHHKILDQTKLKAFADNKLNVTKMIISVFDRVEKHRGKRRTCLYKQILLFLQCFQKASFRDPSKGVIVWEWIKENFKADIKNQNITIVKLFSVKGWDQLLVGQCRSKITRHVLCSPILINTNRLRFGSLGGGRVNFC